MSEQNKELAHRFHMDIFQQGNLDFADEILSGDFARYRDMGTSEGQCGPEGAKQVASMVIGAFSNRQITRHDIIAEGDKVSIR